MSVQPIFILSLPRAGSTLLQRLLSQHSEISTAPEPWIALPLFYALKTEGINSIYGHKPLVNAVDGFINSFPNKKEDYFTCAASFLNAMYMLGSESDTTYFLDKTPRYHLIVDELMSAFPDAKFIFLWRNPLSIAASMIKTWGNGSWNLYMFWVDLFSGIDSLVSSYCKNGERSIAVRYEDLVKSPDDEILRIMSYLDLKHDVGFVKEFKRVKKIDAPGRGDPTGQHRYNKISKDSVDNWKSTLTNPFRIKWAKNYIAWVGQARLDAMGYDINELNYDIGNQQINFNYFMSDIARNIYGKIYCRYAIDEIRINRPLHGNVFYCKN